MHGSTLANHGSGGPPSLTARMKNRARLVGIGVSVVLPWLVFFLVVSLFCFAYNSMKAVVWGVLGGCLALAMVFLILGLVSRNCILIAIGYLCLTSLIVGTALGIWLDMEYLERYWQLNNGIEYKDVDPSMDARMTGNAGIIRFTSDTFIDDKRTLGFVAGGAIYCVAPVSLPMHANASVQYWAAGKDCCEARSNFDCGETPDLGTLTAITQRVSKLYTKAVEQAMSMYGINSSTTSAKLVNFVADPHVAIDGIWDESLTIALIAMVTDLCMCVVAGLVLAKIMIPSAPEQQPFITKP